jgi:hypothetical protein
MNKLKQVAFVVLCLCLASCLCSSKDMDNPSATSDEVIEPSPVITTIEKTSTPTLQGVEFESTTVSNTPTLTPNEISVQEMLEVAKIIDLFYEDHSRYPSDLSELIPDYLLEAPVTSYGQEIWYREDQNFDYVIGFPLTEWTTCVYLKAKDYYECSWNTDG